MSDDYQDDACQDSQAPGLSTGAKVLLIFLSIFGVLCVACCGGVLWIVNSFEYQESNDDAHTAEVRDRIIDIDIPDRFEPQKSMEADASFVESDLAFYESSDGAESAMGFVKVRSWFIPEKDIAEELKNSETRGNFEDADSEARSYQVDGRDIIVTFSHGTVPEGENVPPDRVGKKWYSVNSMTFVDGSLILFFIVGPEEEFDEEEIENMIQSIRFPNDDAETE